MTKEDNQGTGFRARQKKIEKGRAILLLVIIAAAAVYVIGAAFYSRHFYLKNTIYGVKVTNQSVSGLKEKLAKETENYKLTVVSKTGEEIVSAQEIDMQADTDATVDNLKKKQNALLWVSGLFSKAEDVNVDVTFDEEKLKVQADGFSFMPSTMHTPPFRSSGIRSGLRFSVRKSNSGRSVRPVVISSFRQRWISSTSSAVMFS